jgi:uncharacterized membrane protein
VGFETAGLIEQNDAMADQATEHVTIDAPPQRCWETALEFERYPEWAKDLKRAVVLSRDGDDRPQEVEFTAAAMGRSTKYILRYDYSGAPQRLSWSLVEGDIMKALDGSYQFAPSATHPGATDVTYDLSVEVVVPLPGFVKRRAEVRILHTLWELKARVEQ